MPVHAERRVLPYTPAQMFDLVAAIDRYPEFLPWCIGARIKSRQENVILADLIIGFRMIRERFTSRVVLDRPGRIDVSYIDGPLKHLANRWLFEAAGDGGCIIDFHVDFEFRSRILQAAIGALFHEAVRRMVVAFENRAHTVYGPPKSG